MTEPIVPPLRLEDDRLLRGMGTFVEDIVLQDMAFGVVVRATVAHGAVRAIKVSAARAMPGVLTVLTAGDPAVAALGPLSSTTPVVSRDGAPMIEPPRPILASSHVKFVGEAVAFVVADSPERAADAAEAVEIDHDALPAVTGPHAALAEGAPAVWAEAPANVSFDWSAGDADAVRAAFAAARHIARVRVTHPRIVIAPIEPRAAIGCYDPRAGRYTLHAQTQGVHGVRDVLAKDVLGIPADHLRVVTPDVGGSFGMKIYPYPEYALVLVAARLCERPVKWVATRMESFSSDAQGRGRVDDVTLALDGEGRMLGLEIDAVADHGAYLSTVAPYVSTGGAVRVLGHVYRIPAIHYRVRGVFTNAAPVDAYRGAGKPESVTDLERVIDQAARELGVDRIALRRRNLLTPAELPYRTPMGERFDSGDYPALLDRALELADWARFADRADEARSRGRLRGIGVGMYVHTTGGSVMESSEVRAEADGTVCVLTGTQASGQGHGTALAQLVATALEVSIDRVHVIQGDSARLDTGGGTGGSSLLAIAGNTVVRASAAMLERARRTAGHLLEADVVDIEYGSGAFRVAGTDRTVTLAEVAVAAMAAGQGGCLGRAAFEGQNFTYPSGAYVAEVEVDPDTGAVTLVAMSGVDDLGRIINPPLAIGQLHGGLAQGIGTVLGETAVYDADTGQLMTASFVDYWLPRADQLPAFRLEQMPTATALNALGVKGAGEVSTIGAPGAVLNAVADALAGGGAPPLDTPATPLRVWCALQGREDA